MKWLVAFPKILEPMNDKLDRTQKFGDAFLAQQKDLLAEVQRLRAPEGPGQPQGFRRIKNGESSRGGIRRIAVETNA